MNLSFAKVLTIARREYLASVRRPAFLLTLLITPLVFVIAGVFGTSSQIDDSASRMARSRTVAVVDSSGLYAEAPQRLLWTPPTAPTLGRAPAKPVAVRTATLDLKPMADPETALAALERGEVDQVLVVGADFLNGGRARLYEHDGRVFSGGTDRPVRQWLTRNLLRTQADSLRIERTLDLGRSLDLYTRHRDGRWGVKNDAQEFAGFLLPFALGFLLAMSIVLGGQYLLQGVGEEKESRILESLLCSVSSDELLMGKLLGLGSVGLTLVAVWVTAGATSAVGLLSSAGLTLSPSLLALGLAYFLCGYLFYGAIMLSIGALASNLREATQISGYLTMLNVCPFWVLVKFLNDPTGTLPVVMSLFPPTAATSMMLRLSAANVSGAVIPAWQIALSLGLLAASAVGMLLVGSRLFRLGMLLHGKTPNLPEILRILRQR